MDVVCAQELRERLRRAVQRGEASVVSTAGSPLPGSPLHDVDLVCAGQKRGCSDAEYGDGGEKRRAISAGDEALFQCLLSF